MERKYFNVTYRATGRAVGNLWNVNIACADSEGAVKAFYLTKSSVRSDDDIIITAADRDDLESARARHTPIIDIPAPKPATVAAPAAEATPAAPAAEPAPVADPIPAGTRCTLVRIGRRYNGIECRVLRTVKGSPEDLTLVSIPGDTILVKRVNLRPLPAEKPATVAAPRDPYMPDYEGRRRYRITTDDGRPHYFTTARSALNFIRITEAGRGRPATEYARRNFTSRGSWEPIDRDDLPSLVDYDLQVIRRFHPSAAPAAETAPAAPRLHVSAGNSKLGKISNMSLAPGRSCSAEACRTCLVDGCYACKAYRQYGATRRAWNDNTELALHNIPAMEAGLNAVFQGMNAPRFFRVHVGGDFISRDYAEMWIRVAEKAPGTRFLAFTKQFDIIRGLTFPANFTVILSDWPGTVVPADLRQLYRVAWCDDGSRPADTFPADALECPGHCETCGACWNLDRDTIFHKH